MKTLRIVVAIVLTLVVIVSARVFGPNRKYTVTASCPEFTLTHKAPRSSEGDGPAKLQVNVELLKQIPQEDFELALRGNVKGETQEDLIQPASVKDSVYTFEVPAKPWTTRYFYRFEGRIKGKDKTQVVLDREKGEPMMVKFKGPVPSIIWIPHVLAMFAGFFLLIWSSMFSATVFLKGDEDGVCGAKACKLAWWAWGVLFVGGIPIGIAMNYYAFNVYWEAWPFGEDVTDNKTFVALILWGIAALCLTYRRGKKSSLAAMFAGFVTLLIYLIPHSLQL